MSKEGSTACRHDYQESSAVAPSRFKSALVEALYLCVVLAPFVICAIAAMVYSIGVGIGIVIIICTIIVPIVSPPSVAASSASAPKPDKKPSRPLNGHSSKGLLRELKRTIGLIIFLLVLMAPWLISAIYHSSPGWLLVLFSYMAYNVFDATRPRAIKPASSVGVSDKAKNNHIAATPPQVTVQIRPKFECLTTAIVGPSISSPDLVQRARASIRLL